MKRDRREYHRALRATPGYQEKQRLKHAEKMKDPEYAAKERLRERLRSAKRRAAQKELINERARARHAARVITDPAYRRAKADNALRWVKWNAAKAAANVMRREAQKLKAMPVWADKDQIRAIYEAAARRRLAGEDCEVDHIVPLRSKYVCGLHVPQNLALVGPRDNKSKGNRHWPGQ